MRSTSRGRTLVRPLPVALVAAVTAGPADRVQRVVQEVLLVSRVDVNQVTLHASARLGLGSSLGAQRAVRAARTLRTNRAACAVVAVVALRATRPLRTLVTLGASGTLRAWSAVVALVGLGTSVTLVTLLALLARGALLAVR